MAAENKKTEMKAGPGRPAGSKNKLPRDLKEKVLAIADKLEAEGRGLEEEARENPRWFFEHFYKPMLPKNVILEGELSIEKMTDEQLDARIAEFARQAGISFPVGREGQKKAGE